MPTLLLFHHMHRIKWMTLIFNMSSAQAFCILTSYDFRMRRDAINFALVALAT